MKTITKILSVLFITLSLISCDNEELTDFGESTEELVAIVENINSGSSINTYTINNALNTRIDYISGNYQVHTFTDGKMTMVEYFDDETLVRSTSYAYDSDERVINCVRLSPAFNQNLELNFEYTGNKILGVSTTKDNNGVLISENTYTYTLNSNNQLVNYQNEDNSVSWDATYTNGDVTGFSSAGYGIGADGSATFTYSDDLASTPYQIESYRFGSEWRNNVILTQSGTGPFAFKQLAQLGDHYSTGYIFTVDSDPSRQITQTVSYEFDDDGRLSVQTINKLLYGDQFGAVYTYQYQ